MKLVIGIVIFLIILLFCFYNRIQWINQQPKKRLGEISAKYGKPTAISKSPEGMAYWHKPSGCYQWLLIKDEDIHHGNHSDFFYTAVKIDIPLYKLLDVLSISQSMYYDRLQKHLVARCHFEGANIASLLLGVKVVNGLLTLEQIQSEELYKQYMTNVKDLKLEKAMLEELCSYVKN